MRHIETMIKHVYTYTPKIAIVWGYDRRFKCLKQKTVISAFQATY